MTQIDLSWCVVVYFKVDQKLKIREFFLPKHFSAHFLLFHIKDFFLTLLNFIDVKIPVKPSVKKSTNENLVETTFLSWKMRHNFLIRSLTFFMNFN